MAAVAGLSGGGRKGSNDPFKKREPDSKGGHDDDDEEDGPGKAKRNARSAKGGLKSASPNTVLIVPRRPTGAVNSAVSIRVVEKPCATMESFSVIGA